MELNTITDITKIPPSLEKSMETLTGFDREDMDTGGKSLGILQYCHSAASGEVHQIGSDETGLYTKLTGQTLFADGTSLVDRTLMQYHDSGETQYSYWRHGYLIEETGSKSIQVAADFKGYIGYDANGDLIDTITDIRELIVRTPLVAFLYLNETKSTIEWLGDERHGIVMDGQTHLQQHQNQGFFVGGGLDIIGLINNGTTFTSIDAGGCGDEDVKMFYSSISTMPKLYKEGVAGEWTITDDDNKLGIFSGGLCSYNLDTAGTWSLATIGLDYVIMMPIATNNKLAPIVMLVGQSLHANRGAARDNAPAEFHRIDSYGLPSNEYHQLGSIIIHNSGTGQIEIGANGEIWTSWNKNFPMKIFT